MVDLNIEILKSFNGIPFFTDRETVRKTLGMEYKSSESKRQDPAKVEKVKSVMEIAIKHLYEEMGKNPETFEWPDLSPYETIHDSYENFELEYDTDGKFTSIFIDAKAKSFYVSGEKFDFDIKKLLTLADDFRWAKLFDSWESPSKQISICCSKGKNSPHGIRFSHSNYYEFEEDDFEDTPQNKNAKPSTPKQPFDFTESKIIGRGGRDFTEKERNILSSLLFYNKETTEKVKNALPEELKIFAEINPFAENAMEEIRRIAKENGIELAD